MASCMQSRPMPCLATGTAIRSAQRSVSCRAAQLGPHVDRRAAIGGLLGAGLLMAVPAAVAKDIGAAARAKEERRAQLAKAAEDMKSTGKAESAFEDSGYTVGEDHSPNSHSRQEEGARTSK